MTKTDKKTFELNLEIVDAYEKTFFAKKIGDCGESNGKLETIAKKLNREQWWDEVVRRDNHRLAMEFSYATADVKNYVPLVEYMLTTFYSFTSILFLNDKDLKPETINQLSDEALIKILKSDIKGMLYIPEERLTKKFFKKIGKAADLGTPEEVLKVSYLHPGSEKERIEWLTYVLCHTKFYNFKDKEFHNNMLWINSHPEKYELIFSTDKEKIS